MKKKFVKSGMRAGAAAMAIVLGSSGILASGSAVAYAQDEVVQEVADEVQVEGTQETENENAGELTEKTEQGEETSAVESETTAEETEDAKEEAQTLEENATQKSVILTVGSDESSRNLTWYADTDLVGEVQYAPKAADGEFPAEYQTAAATVKAANDTGFYSNQATLANLKENTVYVYRVKNGETVSEACTFTTGVFDGNFKFAFVGDPQIGASGNAGSDADNWGKTIDTIQALNDEFILSAGDQVNTATNEAQYAGYLNEVFKSIPSATSIGNHDSGSAAYNEHFNLPNESDKGVTAAGTDYWYVYGNTLFMDINSNNKSTAEHKAFMEEAIAANPNVTWKTVVFHHSVYSTASHVNDSEIVTKRNELPPVFEELGIDVVLMGHDHVYTRTYMLEGQKKAEEAQTAEDTELTNPNGILYLTANSASGSKYYDIKVPEADYSAKMDQSKRRTVTDVEVTDTSYTVTTYYADDMSMLDTFTIKKEAPVTPVVQKSVVLNIGSDESSRNLTWYADTDLVGEVQYAPKTADGEFPAEYQTTAKVTSTPATDAGFYTNRTTIEGLKENTEYVYRLVNGATVSKTYEFKTGTFDGNFKFAFVGDPQIGASGNTGSDADNWGKTIDTIQTLNDEFIVSAGDQVNTASNEGQYTGYLNEALAEIPSATTVGNHDKGSVAYYQHFKLPNEINRDVNKGSDYWYVYGNTLFMDLSTNNASTAEHKAFMEEAIAANPNVTWKTVVFHHSVYSTASHVNDSEIVTKRNELPPVFEELGIDVVLMGHDHVYTRTYMLEGQKKAEEAQTAEDTELINPNGILYLTANSASGSKYYDIKVPEADYSAKMDQSKRRTVTDVEVTDTSYTVTTYYADDMSMLDTFTIKKEAPADKAALEETIAAASTLMDSEKEYTAESWNVFTEAYEAALEIMEKEDASQEEIDAANATLTAAMSGLVKVDDNNGGSDDNNGGSDDNNGGNNGGSNDNNSGNNNGNNQNNVKPDNGKPSGVKTGDTANVFGVSLLAAAAGSVAVFFGRRRKIFK